MSKLFSPTRIGQLELPNRLVVAPMCQYSATDGTMNDWHMIHLGSMAMSGAGLVFVEATGVEPEGRITAGCTGLYSDANEAAMKRVLAACRAWGQARIGIQLGHAGRKASAQQPWQGGKSIPANDTGGWQISAPSALAFDTGWQLPHEFSLDDIRRVQTAFVDATRRAVRVGFDCIEMHSAHGYLGHQFLSPLSNKRTDAYGGSLENRMRFGLETFAAMREVCPKGYPLGVRISAIDWVEGGWDLESSIIFTMALKELGCDFIDVSSGGTDPKAKVQMGPGYQVPFAAEIKKQTGIATMAVGMITEAEQAEGILNAGGADLIAIARAFLDDPRWGWHAAVRLGDKHAYPVQYERVTHGFWPFTKKYAAPLPKAAE